MNQPEQCRRTSPRVAIFTDAIAERNGAGAYYHDLAGQLTHRVERLEMFSPARKHRLPFALPLPGDSTQQLLTPNVPRLWRQFKALEPDLVITVTPGPFGLLGLYMARRYNTGFLSAFHTHFEELTRMYFGRVTARVMETYLVAVNKRLCRRSATVLVNNSELIPTVEALGARRVDVVGTLLGKCFIERSAVAPVRKLKRVLFAGRLAPEKNLASVIEAARALPSLEFVIAGDGPLRKRLEAQASDLKNVQMPGWLAREALLEEMDRADLLVLPSKLETFGTVALEAMSRGRPALVAESAGIHDWSGLAEGIFCLKSGQGLSDALRELDKLAPHHWERKSAAARAAALRLNTETVDQWLGLLTRHAAER